MASAHNHHHHTSVTSSSKQPKTELLSLPASYPHSQPLKKHCTTDEKNPNPSITTTTTTTTTTITGADEHPLPMAPPPQDVYLSKSSHLTRQEVLKRRSHHLKQLSKCYRDDYWSLMEELRIQYRDYLWKYGVSPFKEDEEERERESAAAKDFAAGDGGDLEGSGENNNNNSSSGGSNLLCAFYGCKLKAMALTSFCNLHILSDSKQQLYKPCDYVIKSAQAGPITCGKPILRSTVPCLCSVHFQKAQKHVTRALKKAGLNVTSSSKLAPKFHVVVTEYVREIQAKRKVALRANRNNVVVKKEALTDMPEDLANRKADLENMPEEDNRCRELI